MLKADGKVLSKIIVETHPLESGLSALTLDVDPCVMRGFAQGVTYSRRAEESGG